MSTHDPQNPKEAIENGIKYYDDKIKSGETRVNELQKKLEQTATELGANRVKKQEYEEALHLLKENDKSKGKGKG